MIAVAIPTLARLEPSGVSSCGVSLEQRGHDSLVIFPSATSCIQVVMVRFLPGEDLLDSLRSLVLQHKIEAAIILSCVGSLERAALRLASGTDAEERQGPFEIVSLVGTVSMGGWHIHTSLADIRGVTWGGHLLGGCSIFTTAEMALGLLPELSFERSRCEHSGWDELVIHAKENGQLRPL